MIFKGLLNGVIFFALGKNSPFPLLDLQMKNNQSADCEDFKELWFYSNLWLTQSKPEAAELRVTLY